MAESLVLARDLEAGLDVQGLGILEQRHRGAQGGVVITAGRGFRDGA